MRNRSAGFFVIVRNLAGEGLKVTPDVNDSEWIES